MSTQIESTNIGTELEETSLMGSLETWPLVDIILWIYQTRRSAMLRVGTGLDAGVLFFRQGNLFRCEWGGLLGEQALLGLLSLQQGSFSLMTRPPPDARPNIGRPTGELLLQYTIAQDEQRRALGA